MKRKRQLQKNQKQNKEIQGQLTNYNHILVKQYKAVAHPIIEMSLKQKNKIAK
jgi:hypothetical protein